MRIVISSLAILVTAMPLPAEEAASLAPAGQAFFETKIRPVLVEHCYECHAKDTKILQGGLRVDHPQGLLQGGDSGPAIVPGKAAESLLIQALRYEGVEMPPKGKLPDAVIQDFEAWVAMGAPDPRPPIEVTGSKTIDIEAGRQHWSFQPVAAPPTPPVKDTSWPLDPIDHFILAKLEDAGIMPVVDADRYSWLRRVSFDLTGLPPTLDDVEAFIRDNSPSACETVVDRLLNSRAFGERWARHWLDLTGYADMMGTSNNVFAEHAWRYRDYVIAALNKDKPFDRFVREQIAGDLMPFSSIEERAENLVATGFLMVGDVKIVEPDKPKMVADHVDSQLSKIGTVFLGMTLGCVRCHDHKFDPIATEDYYGMAGMLHSSPSTHKIPFGVWSKLNEVVLPETPIQKTAREERETQHAAKLAAMKLDQKKLNEEKSAVSAALAKLQAKPVSIERPPSGEVSEGEGSMTAAEVVATATEEKASDSPSSETEVMAAERKKLAEQLAKLTADLKSLATNIQHAEFFSSQVPKAFAMQDGEEPVDMPVFIRGNPYAKGAIISRGVLRVASWQEFPEIPAGQSGRLQLADWLADPRNPLTARVTVNRIWQKLFGEGLVRSVDYFGVRGEAPTHPELLDHLATRFVNAGWSQKQMIRAIVLSRVYRLGSMNDPAAMEKDPDNRLLWRMNRQRLDAESIRDGLLAVTGELLASQGGPALALEVVENTGALVQSGVNPPNYRHAKPRPSEEFQRTLYLPVMRTGYAGPDKLRGFFDFVDPAQIAGQRNQTVSATQSLFLLNNKMLRDRSKKFVERLLAEEPDAEVRLERMWLTVFSRPITRQERTEAQAFLDDLEPPLNSAKAAAASESLRWQELCHSLFASNLFLYRL
jgi:hypothetical protein